MDLFKGLGLRTHGGSVSSLCKIVSISILNALTGSAGDGGRLSRDDRERRVGSA